MGRPLEPLEALTEALPDVQDMANLNARLAANA